MLGLLFLLILPQVEGPLDLGDQKLREGQLLAAEGFYLSAAPEVDAIPQIGERLAHIGLRTYSTAAKRDFFKTYLTKSRNWRGVALFVLAALAAEERDWDAFQTNATLFLKEFGPLDDLVMFRFVYYLARYTRLEESQLVLTDAQTEWFRACRTSPAGSVFPAGGLNRVPYALRHAHLLEKREPFEIPTLVANPSPEDRYVHQLLVVREGLNRQDPYRTAEALNQISRPDRLLHWRMYDYPLLMAFYKERGMNERIAPVQRNLDLISSWTVLPYTLIPQRLVRLAEVDRQPHAPLQPSEETPTTPTAGEAAIADASVDAPVAEPDPDSFPGLETLLERNHRGLELKVRALEPQTTYQKIYRNYLLGLYFLKAGRGQAAFEQLQLAEKLVRDFPFPVLETKILMALAQFHEQDGDENKANWYRISAIQIWNAPENLALFVNGMQANQDTPYAVMLDRALADATSQESLHQLLYYSESNHFQQLRRLAFQRNTLSANPVLGNQIKQIGNQLAQLVASLADNPQHKPNPKRYNDTLEIWNQLWTQTLPFYRDASIPSVAAVQAMLTRRDRVLAFVEGRQNLGVLVISQAQAFAVALGSRANYRTMSPKARFDFLEGRLGPVWKHDGALFLKLSQSFKNIEFINQLKQRMAQPDLMRIIFSLKSFAARKEVGACRKISVFSESLGSDITTFLSSLPQASLDLFDEEDITRDNMAATLETHDHLIYFGALSRSPEGVLLGPAAEGFLLHEILHYNPNICSLTLVSDSIGGLNNLVDELELISPQASVSIVLASRPTDVPSLDLNQKSFGIRFP